VWRERSEATRCSRKGRKQTTNFPPAADPFPSPSTTAASRPGRGNNAPGRKIPPVDAVYRRGLHCAFLAMDLITILNRCHHFRRFVYQHARFSPDKKSIEISVRPRRRSATVCSRCHQPAPGYDQLAERRFELSPSGDSWSSSFTRCGASTAAAATRSLSKRFLGATANGRSARRICSSSPAGPATFPGKNRSGLSYFLGEGLRRRRARRHLGAGTRLTRPDRRHRLAGRESYGRESCGSHPSRCGRLYEVSSSGGRQAFAPRCDDQSPQLLAVAVLDGANLPRPFIDRDRTHALCV
jgi:hypothetical protein